MPKPGYLQSVSHRLKLMELKARPDTTRLATIRREMGLSQLAAAKQIGICKVTMYFAESGRKRVSRYVLNQICTGLNVTAQVKDGIIIFNK